MISLCCGKNNDITFKHMVTFKITLTLEQQDSVPKYQNTPTNLTTTLHQNT